MRYIAYTFLVSVFFVFGCKSSKKLTNKEQVFKTTQNGIRYKIVKDVAGKQYPKVGDFVEIHIKTSFEDSLIFDSRTQSGNQPVKFPVMEPSFNGDLSEVVPLLTVGDSAVFFVAVDTLKAAKQKLQPWMEEGKEVQYSIELASIQTAAEAEAERLAKAEAAGNPEKDDEALQAYFKKNNIQPQKAAAGLYYLIKDATDEQKPLSGQTVSVNYTGRLLNGSIFDSNKDKDSFTFILGRGQVIRGWDIGIALLKKGEKAVLYIPSHLAYGANSPTEAIPPHSILIFDVELVDF